MVQNRVIVSSGGSTCDAVRWYDDMMVQECVLVQGGGAISKTVRW